MSRGSRTSYVTYVLRERLDKRIDELPQLQTVIRLLFMWACDLAVPPLLTFRKARDEVLLEVMHALREGRMFRHDCRRVKLGVIERVVDRLFPAVVSVVSGNAQSYQL